MIEQDLPKDPIVAKIRAHRDVPSLFLETDKSSHKHVVCLLALGILDTADESIEKASVKWLLAELS